MHILDDDDQRLCAGMIDDPVDKPPDQSFALRLGRCLGSRRLLAARRQQHRYEQRRCFRPGQRAGVELRLQTAGDLRRCKLAIELEAAAHQIDQRKEGAVGEER